MNSEFTNTLSIETAKLKTNVDTIWHSSAFAFLQEDTSSRPSKELNKIYFESGIASRNFESEVVKPAF